MRSFSKPWFFCGGWAVDLHLGRETREHQDLEIGIFREDQDALRRHLEGWSFEKAVAGKLLPWPAGDRLETPQHEAYAKKDGFVLEILLNELNGGAWAYRRDTGVRLPLAEAVRKAGDFPYLCPEAVLLFKSKKPRDKDEMDMRNLLPVLTPDARRWLRCALGQGHPWLGKLTW